MKAIKKLLSRNTQFKPQIDEAKSKMKLLSTAVAICLALSYVAITAEGAEGAEGVIPQCTQGILLYEANLDTGDSDHYWSNTDYVVTELPDNKLVRRSRSGRCDDWEGLLEIKLPQKRALGFKFTYVRSPNDLGFPSFHIGDSIYNEAVDVPIASTLYSAEIFNDGHTLKLHANREPGRPIIPPVPSFIDQSHDTMIIVGHQFVKAYNGAGQMEYYQDYLFPLYGSTGAEEVYVGLNRIINDESPKSGEGLCKVKVYAFKCN